LEAVGVTGAALAVGSGVALALGLGEEEAGFGAAVDQTCRVYVTGELFVVS
jgi:hypothetical protein